LKNSFIKIYLLVVVISISYKLPAQIINLPAENETYFFLKKMQVDGILKEYSDYVLPVPKEKIIDAIKQLDTSRQLISFVERDYLDKLKQKYLNYNTNQVPVFSNFPEQVFSDKPKNLYFFYNDEITFIVNPLLDFKYIYSKNKYASLLNAGGEVKGRYSDWFEFEISAVNGSVFGNRNVALFDKRVKQSYTFNHTEINYFDGTTGSMYFHKGIFDLQIGRDRLLWGNGYINREVLSNNPPIFDFIKLSMNYKNISYNYLHGWLSAIPRYNYYDSVNTIVKSRTPKYISIARLGYQDDNFATGISQIMIYAQRPMELAYLNPFLFWESAQRSMNDNDNGFLSFDGKYLIKPGIEINASIIFDDINFQRYFKGEWNTCNNRLMWQIGTILTNPISLDNVVLRMEYFQIRPFTFTHDALSDALTFTNNGYMLGPDAQPNSARLSLALDYYLSSRLRLNVEYFYQIHGNNSYDKNGKITRNVGGDVNGYSTLDVPTVVYFLEGERDFKQMAALGLSWELFPGYYLNFNYEYHAIKFQNSFTRENFFTSHVIFSFN